jgi:hypothetical protein
MMAQIAAWPMQNQEFYKELGPWHAVCIAEGISLRQVTD